RNYLGLGAPLRASLARRSRHECPLCNRRPRRLTAPRLSLFCASRSRETAMTADGWVQSFAYVLVLTGLSYPLGIYMARVYNRPVGAIERVVYSVAGVDPTRGQDWKRYALSVLIFSLIGTVFVYVLQRVQGGLPLNPDQMGAV